MISHNEHLTRNEKRYLFFREKRPFISSMYTKSKGLLSFSLNESPSYIIILSRLPFRMNQLAKIQWHCPVIDDIVSSRWGEQSIQRGNSHAPWSRYHATTFYFELWSRSFPPRMSRYPLHFHSFSRLRSVEPRSVTAERTLRFLVATPDSSTNKSPASLKNRAYDLSLQYDCLSLSLSLSISLSFSIFFFYSRRNTWLRKKDKVLMLPTVQT